MKADYTSGSSLWYHIAIFHVYISWYRWCQQFWVDSSNI